MPQSQASLHTTRRKASHLDGLEHFVLKAVVVSRHCPRPRHVPVSTPPLHSPGTAMALAQHHCQPHAQTP
eukprot:1553271-Rhodomonas_salina.2